MPIWCYDASCEDLNGQNGRSYGRRDCSGTVYPLYACACVWKKWKWNFDLLPVSIPCELITSSKLPWAVLPSANERLLSGMRPFVSLQMGRLRVPEIRKLQSYHYEIPITSWNNPDTCMRARPSLGSWDVICAAEIARWTCHRKWRRAMSELNRVRSAAICNRIRWWSEMIKDTRLSGCLRADK